MDEYFTIREDNGLRLIVPAHSAAVGNAAWHPHNLWWRSRVETTYGDVVSQGFGKFFNLGQGPETLNIGLKDVARACESGDAVATLKLDGSLLIRSVYQGRVMLRTRGSFGFEHLDNAFEMEEFQQKYPALFDPTIAGNYSTLLEWVSPNNTIVLKYPEPALTVIGAVDHRAMTYVSLSELQDFARIFGVPLVHTFPLTVKGWEDMNADLEKNREIEGYVIRLNREQSLVKVKCLPYLTKHALKSRLTSETLADMYFQYGRPDFGGFIAKFSCDFDEETAMWAMPAISSLYDGVRELVRIEAHIQEKVDAAHRLVEHDILVNSRLSAEEGIRRLARKEFAIATQKEYGRTKKFAYAMAAYLGETHDFPKLLKSVLLQNTKQIELSFLKPGRDDLEPDDGLEVG